MGTRGAKKVSARLESRSGQTIKMMIGIFFALIFVAAVLFLALSIIKGGL